MCGLNFLSFWTEACQKKSLRSWTKLKTQTPEKADQHTSSIFYLQSVDSQELFQWTKKFLQIPYSKNNAVYNVRDRRFCAAAHWYLIFANDVTQSVHDKTDMQAKKLLTFSFSWVMEKAIAESPYSALQAINPKCLSVVLSSPHVTFWIQDTVAGPTRERCMNYAQFFT